PVLRKSDEAVEEVIPAGLAVVVAVELGREPYVPQRESAHARASVIVTTRSFSARMRAASEKWGTRTVTRRSFARLPSARSMRSPGLALGTGTTSRCWSAR